MHRTYFPKELTDDPGSSDILNKAGHDCFMNNDFIYAADCFERALYVAPNSLNIRSNLCNALVMSGKFEKAVHVSGFYAGQTGDADAHRRLWVRMLSSCLKHCMENNEYLKSLEIIGKMISAGAELDFCRINMSYACKALGVESHNKGQYPQAQNYFAMALGLNPDDVKIMTSVAESYYCRGVIALGENAFDEAISFFRKALALSPDKPDALSGLSAALSQQGIEAYNTGHFEQAVSLYEQSLMLRPEQGPVFNNLALACARAGNYAQALLHARNALALSPESIPTLTNAGIILQYMRDYDEAARHYFRALAMHPGETGFLKDLGFAFHSMGDKRKALDCFFRAIAIEPHCMTGLMKLSMDANTETPAVNRNISHGTDRAKIYDCFTFFNELDMLELRLNELYEHVDRFVLVESNKTHTCQDKPLYYADNKSRFAQFADKITHIVLKVDDVSELSKNPWLLEGIQRDYIAQGLTACRDNDLIVISDVDEIPRSSIFPVLAGNQYLRLEMSMYFFYLDCMTSAPWYFPVALPYARLKKLSPQQARVGNSDNILFNAGWHFSFLGGIDRILDKIRAFAVTDINDILDMDKLEVVNKIRAGRNIFNQKSPYHPVYTEYRYMDIDDSYPRYVKENPDWFARLGWFGRPQDGAGITSPGVLPPEGYYRPLPDAR